MDRIEWKTRRRAGFILAAGIVSVLISSASTDVQAQSSASFKLEESTLNAGGRPEEVAISTSASFRMTSDAIGDAAVTRGLQSTSFRADVSFLVAYPPPLEVKGLQVAADKQTLSWSPERSTGDYNLYRDLLTNLPGLGYGACEQQDIVSETATDSATPPAADGYFYIVTAENRLDEEGTRGYRSSGIERHGPTCP